MAWRACILGACLMTCSAAHGLPLASAGAASGLWAPQPVEPLTYSGDSDSFGTGLAWGIGDVELFVGIPGDNSVSVFKRSSPATPWGAPARLSCKPGCDAISASYGCSVALGGNGTLLAVGAPGQSHGVVYVYTRAANTTAAFRLVQNISSPVTNSSYGDFGAAVAWDASNSGTILLVGASSQGNFVGGAHMYRRAGTSRRWTHVAAIAHPDPTATDSFGATVALSPDGGVAVVAAPGWSNAYGAVYVFAVTSGGTVALLASLTNPLHRGCGAFGSALSLVVPQGQRQGSAAATAPLLAVGAPGCSYAFVNGTAAVFLAANASLASWLPIAGLWLGSDDTDYFGSAVAFDADARSLAVGARGSQTGAVLVYSVPAVPSSADFANADTTVLPQWPLVQTLRPAVDQRTAASFGSRLAVWVNNSVGGLGPADGTQALAVGAPQWGSYRGAVLTFGRSATPV
jgi:hypothetical protein